jgi:PAS domain S-box-containing protein
LAYTVEEVIGQHAAIIFTPEDRRREMPLKEMETARETGRAADERWHVRKDGTRFYVSGVLSALHDADGAVIGYVKIARDLTEQRQTEEELRRANDELEARVRERTFELAKVNESLRDEISERIQTERDRVRLLRQIVRAQEDERRRIARDIHDQVGQQMTALRLNLARSIRATAETENYARNWNRQKQLPSDLTRTWISSRGNSDPPLSTTWPRPGHGHICEPVVEAFRRRGAVSHHRPGKGAAFV